MRLAALVVQDLLTIAGPGRGRSGIRFSYGRCLVGNRVDSSGCRNPGTTFYYKLGLFGSKSASGFKFGHVCHDIKVVYQGFCKGNHTMCVVTLYDVTQEVLLGLTIPPSQKYKVMTLFLQGYLAI